MSGQPIDEWAAYRKVYEELGFDHETVNHSKNYVNPLTGVHTQAIESYWNKHKAIFKQMRGEKHHCLNSYLQ